MDLIHETSLDNVKTPVSDVGVGLCGSLFYDFDFEYIYEYLINAETNIQAFVNIYATIFANLLNAAMLYSYVIIKETNEQI